MTKYRKKRTPALVVALLCVGSPAWAGELDQAFEPRAVPGIELASLDVPVRRAPAQPEPERIVAPEPAPQAAEPEKDFWDRAKEFFGL